MNWKYESVLFFKKKAKLSIIKIASKMYATTTKKHSLVFNIFNGIVFTLMKIKMRKSNKYSLIEYILYLSSTFLFVCVCTLDECSWNSIRLPLFLLSSSQCICVCFEFFLHFAFTATQIHHCKDWIKMKIQIFSIQQKNQ